MPGGRDFGPRGRWETGGRTCPQSRNRSAFDLEELVPGEGCLRGPSLMFKRFPCAQVP